MMILSYYYNILLLLLLSLLIYIPATSQNQHHHQHHQQQHVLPILQQNGSPLSQAHQANQQQPYQDNQQPYLDHHQQQQQQHHQLQQHWQAQQQVNEQQSHSVSENLQQVMLDGPEVQYTQFAWRSESTHDGSKFSGIYMQGYEAHGHPMVMTQEMMEYHEYQVSQQLHNSHIPIVQVHHQSHIVYSSRYGQDLVDDSRPCEPIDPFEEPTCRATSATLGPQGSSSDSSGNVPNFSHYSNSNNKPSHNSNVESFPLATHHYHYESSLMAAIRHYWREVSGLCLASAIFLNWLFVVVKRKFISSGLTRAEHAIETIQQRTRSSKSVSKDTNSGGSAHDSAFEENASPISLDDGDSSSQGSSLRNNISSSNNNNNNNVGKPTFSVQQIQLQPSVETPVMRQRSSTLRADAMPTQLSISPNDHTPLSLSNSVSSTSEYNSRYSSDFDSIQRLGRGGFGIVFEARNKIDDCHYAVKRICLPLQKEARERVMREVRALAKLDHAGIVRYYNAWLEAPPDEWLKQHDAQLGILHSKDGMSFPSTDGIYDRIESDTNITKHGGKILESGDNSSSLFGKFKKLKRTNGFSKFLKKNSSSPSLDIVFEGSGSIRLEAENTTEKTKNSKRMQRKQKQDRNSKWASSTEELEEKYNGDNNHSDSEDSDFIQFESKHSNDEHNGSFKHDEHEGSSDEDANKSTSSHLTEPFSSSDSDLDDNKHNGSGDDIKKLNRLKVEDGRKKALTQQKQMRQNMNNSALVESLHAEKAYLYIQMQLCRKDTLKDWLKTNCETRDKTTIFDLFYQIVDAVEYVHSQDLIHRDLKPSNIFFSLDGTLKIGDFGLCRAKTNAGVGSSLDLQEYVAESDVERGFEAVHTEQVGTQLYMSPEQLNGLSYNQKVDIFAMGLILLELLIPFKTQMQRVNVLFKARNNLYSDEFKIEHPSEHELVKSLLNRSPQKRPTANEIKQHDLLASAQLSQPVIERIYHRRRTISSNSSTE